MKAVIQRVSRASVTVDGKIISEIKSGLLILLGIEDADSDEDIEWLSRKIINLRIFNDSEGVMNNSLLDIDGDAIVVSQFTFCLLYTSDAADDLLCVDLGGRRIIKKKKK